MYLKKALLTGFFILLLLGLYVLPAVNISKHNGVNAAEKRETIAENGLGGLPTVVVLVDFVREQRIDEADFLRGLFAGENSINSYFKEISYESLWLEKDDLYHVKVDSPASHYSWGYTATDLETDKVKELTLDVFEKVLESAPEAVFQDKIVIFVLNVSTDEMQGRGAMCLVPGNTPFPKQTYPENQELFVGYFRESPKDPEIRKACLIDTTYPFNSPDPDKGYINERRVEFHRTDKQDEFIRGLAIFCNDALLSCAVHDVLHTVKRFSDQIPTSDNPGARARAIPCLYSLALQTEWLNSGNLAIYCTPFVGWWDNTGDHQHLNPDDRNGFMDGDPYGVSAFTKLRLGVIPEVEVRGDSAFQLAALALPDCPQDALRAVKIPLDESGNEYLLVEYRRNIPGTVEGVKVNHDILMGHGGPTVPVNPPKYLVPGKGVLVYHVNENEDIREAGCPTTKPWPEGCPEDPAVLGITRNNQFVTNFVIFLYTPSMVENNVPGGIVDYPKWHEYTVRRPIDLRDAGFYPGETFKLRRNQEIITIHVVDFDDQLAQVEVTREST